MAWRPAPSVKLGLTEANARWPDRSVASDGLIGDTAHSSRLSDHNPDENGVVHAYDLTHDPAHGVDCGRLSEQIRLRRDPRVRYVIFNRRIYKGPWSDSVMAGRAQPWLWEEYTGPSPHTGHMHVSVGYATTAETDLRPWYGPAEPEDELTPEDKKWVEAKLDQYSRESARFTDHGDNGTPGAGNHLAKVREELRQVRADVAELKALLTPPPPPPASP